MKFTVLIPTHDNGPVIRNAIDSALAQTHADLELFVVADGAPPTTLALLDDCAARDARLRIFRFEKGERHGEAWRHQALREATGEAVCYLSDDDVWFPHHLETMAAMLAEADLAHTRFTQVTPGFTVFAFPMEYDLADPAIRARMVEEKFNFFGLTAAGHRLDAYRRLPEGWAPGPPDLWTDLNMWRKFLLAEGMRFRSSGAATALHIPRSKRPGQDEAAVLNEVAFWRETFRDPAMREALRRLLPPDASEVSLSQLAKHARSTRAQALASLLQAR